MDAAVIAGTFRWIPAAENGPTLPFAHERISAFAYVHPDHRHEAPILVRGLQSGVAEQDVEARWVDGYAAPATRAGDVITLTASQRPIATLTVARVTTA